MRRLFQIVLLLISLPSMGFHIVGGEIEFITIAPGLYRINVIQYFDEAQEQNPGPEGQAEVYLYRNSDNRLMSTFILSLDTQENVAYTYQKCAIEELQTSRVVWTRDSVEINPREYDDPEGYYIVWERCCRNSTIVNIRNPSGAGMKYVLEIPPLWQNGRPFINSSPVLFKPVSDYACVNQLFYTEFTGTDPDGDSLVYSLTEPLNTAVQVALPIPQPKPHITIPYRFPEIIPGSEPLKISKRGLLTVNPSDPGLYVFSVLVDEYRNGIKIGQVQRDFQMLVIDGCEPPDPPVVGVRVPGFPSFDSNVDTVRFEVIEDQTFEFIVTNLAFGETINLRAEGVNFEGDIEELFSFTSAFIDEGRDSLLVSVTAPGCPPLGAEPFIVDLIAGDDACPLPQLDTLRLTMQVDPPPNELPAVTYSQPSVIIDEDRSNSLKIIGLDPDGDFMNVSVEIPGIVDLEARGFTLDIISNEAGRIEADLNWDTDCIVYDFSDETRFPVKITVEDADICMYETPNFRIVDHEVVLPPNRKPEITIPQIVGQSIETTANGRISLIVQASDPDGDDIVMSLVSDPFSRVTPSFAEVEGNTEVESLFELQIDCNVLEPDTLNILEFSFVADDFDKCKVKNFDTLQLEVRIDLPKNNAPQIEEPPSRYYELPVNTSFSLPINASDQDFDMVTLDFFEGAPRPQTESLNFLPEIGEGEVSSLLEWKPDCELLRNGEPTLYDLVFVAFDDRCPGSRLDTTRISFLIYEREELFEGFLPPNAFSPNGDGINEEFRLSDLTPATQNLPPDNCGDTFQYVSIHDRTGKRVFYSDSREFSWDGANLPSGMYYYLVKYSSSEYRNYIQLLR